MKTRFYISIVLMACSLRVQSISPCASKLCVCRYNVKSDKDIFSGSVVCSHDPKVLEKKYTLPNTVYSLNLSWNNLTRIKSSSLFQSVTLSELNLSHNRLTDIDSKDFRMPQLKKLDLSDNKLEHIDENMFKNLNNLEFLNLANNKFNSVGKLKLQSLGDLREIILDNNDLGASLENNNLFDRSGYGLTKKIISLSMSGINLNYVHENFFVDAYDIRKLSLARNNISDMFEFPFTLEFLDLSDNPIDNISSEDFDELVALKELRLNNLGIQEVPNYAFASLHSLVDLQLERNVNLTSFSPIAFGQEILEDPDYFTLEKLSLRDSRLQTLDARLEVPFGQLLHLDLQGNLWHCNCKIAWIKNLKIPANDYNHVRCFTPKPLFNSRIFELDQKYFACSVNNNRVSVGIVIVTVCVALTAVAFWIFTYAPRLQSRCHYIRNAHMPTTEYTVLPVHTSLNDY